MKAFWVQMIDLDLVFRISRDVAMATNFAVNAHIELAISHSLSKCQSDK